MSTFVSLGNMKKPFDRLIDIVKKNSHNFPKPIIIQHGHTNIDVDKDRGIICFEFIDNFEFKTFVSEAYLCIGHCGAGFVSTCLEFNKKPMLLARKSIFQEHLDDHQVNFMKYLLNKKIAYELTNKNIIKSKKKEISLVNLQYSRKEYCNQISLILEKKIGRISVF